MDATLLIQIYAEATPNPASMKFVVNNYLVPEEGKVFEFRTKQAAEVSPVAKKIFELPYVKGVFITANFITVTQDESQEWYEVIPGIKEMIKNHLIQGGLILNPDAVIEESKPANRSDIEKKIVEILDEYIRPAVEGDGGAIELKSFESGTVTVVLRGSCSGCPSSTLTLKAGIENLLRRMIPEVDDVIAESL